MPTVYRHRRLVSSETVDLCISRKRLFRHDANAADQLISGAFSQLVSAARQDSPRLRKCTMPEGLLGRLDFKAGRRQEDVPDCGAFFIAKKGGHTCGRERCRKAYRVLGDDYQLELAQQDRRAALRERDRKQAARAPSKPSAIGRGKALPVLPGRKRGGTPRGRQKGN